VTHSELGRAVKQLHPAYAHHADDVIGRAMVRKFPGIYNIDDLESSPPKTGKNGPQLSRTRNLDSGTIPEAPKTLALQMSQLQSGIRRVVFVARGSKAKIDPHQYGVRKMTLPSGEYFYRPDAIKPQEILAAIQNHSLNEILGSKDSGYGSPSKEALQPPVSAVVARSPDGETAHSALTDAGHMGESVRAAESLTPPNGTISAEHPAKELAHRLIAKHKPRAGDRWSKPKTPQGKI
jgi:hypothetical protein